MNESAPAVTVVIPTRDRHASLLRTLDALTRQDAPAVDCDVVVVDDGEGAPRVTGSAGRQRPAVRVITNRGRGAAAARNTGAAAARAPLLLFLDDDIEASPGLVRAHLDAWRAGASLSVGYLPARPSAASGFFAVTLRNWWESMFAEMRRPGHRFTFRDVLTGNLSIDAGLFRQIGGFDTSLACHEDYELGLRALRAGARIVFCAAAEGIHHEVTTLRRSLDRKRAEGRADAMIVRKHPEMLSTLPIGAALHGRRGEPRRLRRLPFTSPRAATALLAGLHRWLDLFEAARMRGRWLRRLYQMLDISYWQGVASELGTLSALDELVCQATRADSRPAWWLRVDLQEGLDRVAQRVDAAHPDGIAVSYRGERVGVVPPSPGAEPMRGVHLRSALSSGPLAWHLLVALGRAGAADLEEREGRLVPTACLPRDALDLR